MMNSTGNSYTPPVTAPTNTGYMNWGNNKMTMHTIDMIADKVAFAVDMINGALLGFDAIEKELVALAGQPTPPQPVMLTALAGRIDTNQQQVLQGLLKIKEMMVEIDRATDTVQGKTGWGY